MNRVGQLIKKGLVSVRQFGVRVTWERVVTKVFGLSRAKRVAKIPLFGRSELEEQRAHRFPREELISIVVPLYNTPERFLREMIGSVLSQTYSGWELCMADGSDETHEQVGRICMEYAAKDPRIKYRKLERNLGISGNTNVCLEMAEGSYIGLFDHDDLLHPAALHEVMQAICRYDADFIYTDENTFRNHPRDAYNPHFKPDFAPDNLRANNYICHFSVFRRTLLNEAGLFEPACDGSQDHDMVLRLTEKARCIVHIPEILYYWRAHAESVAGDAGVKPYVAEAGVRAVERHLRRTGLEGEASPVKEGLTIYRTRYKIKSTPKISVVIPNRDHYRDLCKCLDSIFRKTTWPEYEIIIVENNSKAEDIFEYYRQIREEHANVRVVTWEAPFNYASVNNFGVRHCTGEYILLLNNDTEIITPSWMEELLMFAQRADVGAVGAKLYYPDYTIQHGGVCVGMGGAAAHLFQGVSRGNPGYMGRLIYAQDLSAVTGACMMIRRDVWEKTGGLDERFSIDYNDIDLCLRIREEGLLIVWTPFAELYHHESASRGKMTAGQKAPRFFAERSLFLERWKAVLEAGDPYFSPNMTLEKCDFTIGLPVRKHDARVWRAPKTK